MKKLFFIFLCLLALPLLASHIVGGEFELLHVSGSTYRLNLIVYFDKSHGAPGAKDLNITASIFRKKDNVFVRTITLPLSNESAVGYTQPECSNGEIETNKITYTSLIDLPADQYNDPAGYYVSWERCCRNYAITNIYSQDPAFSSSISAGQTFYLEFPPVVKNGNPFINSSPHLFPPLNDYACPNRFYYVDFAGVDDDGDSLVYSLAAPLNTHTSQALPGSYSAPYPEVIWRPDFSITNIIKGNPDLHISKDGLLTCTPTTQGLYVFGVKVEEFRNKEKIGESRRDFQMLVLNACPQADPPQIVGKKLTDASFTYDNSMNVSFNNTIDNANRCIEVRVSDPDSQKPDQNFSGRISLRVIGLNFKNSQLNEILPAVKSATLTNGSTADFRICFPSCPYVDGPYQIGIIAMDDACSLPLLDTLKVTVNVEPPINHDPYFTTPVANTAQIHEGDKVAWPFQVKDDEDDELILYLVTDGFELADVGMKFEITDQQNGLINGQLSWDALCDVYDFSNRTRFNIKIMVDDQDQCKFNDPVIAGYDLSIILPGNADPVVDTNLTSDPMEKVVDGIERKIYQPLNFNVTGSDLADNDQITLRMAPVDFNPSDFGITFPKTTAKGFTVSNFNWNLDCTKLDLKKKDIFEMMFIAVDSTNKCRIRKADTVNVKIKVLPLDNTAPYLTVANLNPELTLTDNQLDVTVGQQIVLNLEGYDADYLPQKDSLKLSLAKVNSDYEPEGYSFANAEGIGWVSSIFTWSPDCSIFADDIFEKDYHFKFRIVDKRCNNSKADSVTVKIKLKDKGLDSEEFIPVNVFTPNGDGINDYYAMETADENTHEPVNILPPDNCRGSFELIRIFNRWGNLVFESRDRNFKWYGKNEAAGVYYYLIKYTNREYKGPLSLRY